MIEMQYWQALRPKAGTPAAPAHQEQSIAFEPQSGQTKHANEESESQRHKKVKRVKQESEEAERRKKKKRSAAAAEKPAPAAAGLYHISFLHLRSDILGRHPSAVATTVFATTATAGFIPVLSAAFFPQSPKKPPESLPWPAQPGNGLL
jgi:uncharacterized membrane protein YdbT with pleckstrin-like domain